MLFPRLAPKARLDLTQTKALGVAVRSGVAAAVPLLIVLSFAADVAAGYMHLPTQLAAANKSLEEVDNLLQMFDSLSLLQRKTRATMSAVCKTVEGAALALCSGRTGISLDLPREEAKEGEEDEEERE